jgi:serine/threonine-protein kinase RsbT
VESADVENLMQLLTAYISPVNAKALVLRALRENELSPVSATRHDLRKCSATLRRGVELFVSAQHRADALSKIAGFCGIDSLSPNACSLLVQTEADVGKVRSEARRICDAAGANKFIMQKVATIASELARNIVLYAQRGTVEIVPTLGVPRRIVIRALDQGAGIPHLDVVLSGKYQSKTGLGRGLLGTKRLADRFDISTGGAGTQVVVEVTL